MSRHTSGSRALRKAFEKLQQELVLQLKLHYGARLVSAVVFGSVGRGSPRRESDVDILIVADPLPDGRMRRVEEFQTVKQAMATRLRSLHKAGIYTSLAPVFKTPAEVRRGSLLFLDMIEDGKLLHDPLDFWESFLRDFQERLRRLGARKIVEGDRWYWDLKPDYKVGEIFEI